MSTFLNDILNSSYQEYQGTTFHKVLLVAFVLFLKLSKWYLDITNHISVCPLC